MAADEHGPTGGGSRGDDGAGLVDPGSDAPVSTVEVAAPIDVVWAAVSDPRTYPLWLVGAQRIRAVDDRWPAPGSAFHHTVGWLPARVRDRTEAIEVDPPRMLVLRAHISALGAATVTITLEDTAEGRTRLSIGEAPHDGLLRLIWSLGGRSLLRLGLWGRNTQSLHRLRAGLEDGVIIGHEGGGRPPGRP